VTGHEKKTHEYNKQREGVELGFGKCMVYFFKKNMPLDDLATTCNGIGGQDTRHYPILSRGRP
jgi:hypothetical protein